MIEGKDGVLVGGPHGNPDSTSWQGSSVRVLRPPGDRQDPLRMGKDDSDTGGRKTAPFFDFTLKPYICSAPHSLESI